MNTNKSKITVRTVVSALILLVLDVGVFAQTEMERETQSTKPFRIGVGIGSSYGGYRDETDSEINRYYNNRLTYLINGNIEKRYLLHTFDIGFFMGENTVASKFEDKYSPPRYFSYRANIKYALDHRLWGCNRFPGYLGGAFRTDFYFVTQTLEIAKYAMILSLGVHATQKWYMHRRHSLVATAGLPLLGYAARSPYPGVDHIQEKHMVDGKPLKILTEGTFAGVHNYWAMFGDLKYHFQATKWLSLHAGMGVELSRINVPLPRIDAMFRINAGLSFTF